MVVQCEFVNNETNSEFMCNDCDNGGKKIIYLHLKKFFRGTRFTYQPFLMSIQSKYEEGDCVCVSGKVRAFVLFFPRCSTFSALVIAQNFDIHTITNLK